MPFLQKLTLLILHQDIAFSKKHFKDKECSILHRDDGPAVEYENGTKEWYINGQLHREDGPAVEWHDGSKWWMKNSTLHREDGPAIEDTSVDYKTIYFLDDQGFSEEGFYREISTRRFGNFV